MTNNFVLSLLGLGSLLAAPAIAQQAPSSAGTQPVTYLNQAWSQDDREWALDFAEFREQQTSRFQQARKREAEAISDISDRIAT